MAVSCCIGNTRINKWKRTVTNTMKHNANACWPRIVPCATSSKMPTIQADPTLQVRGIIIAQYISVSAIQSGRKASAHSGRGTTISISDTMIVMITGSRWPPPLLIAFVSVRVLPDIG